MRPFRVRFGALMPLDPRARRFLDMAAMGAGEGGRVSIVARRAALDKLMQFARADAISGPGIDGTLPGRGGKIPTRLYAPDHAAPLLPGLVFFHGGGLVAGGIDSHDVICRALAQAAQCRLISVGYRLAPEHKFPAAIDDVIDATRAVAERAAALGIDAAKLMIGGDSAGATLAAVVCQHAQRGEAPPIALQVLICPVLDFATPWPSRQKFARGYLIDETTLKADLADYLPDGADLADARISPLRAASLAGQPRAIIHSAEFDPLRDEADAYAQRLLQAGVAVEHTRHDGMIHNFHALGGILPQGRAVLSQIGEQIRMAMGQS
jgi:acetyl esterase/lipase